MLSFGCSRTDKKAPNAANPGPNDHNFSIDKPETGEGESKVAAQILLQLNITQPGDTTTIPVSFVDVQSTFQKCQPCHATGATAPDLSAFPFLGKGDESLSSVMSKVALRIDDPQNPMPPAGMLPNDDRKLVSNWIAAGFLAEAPASADLASYFVDISWDLGAGKSPWTRAAASPAGLFAVDLGSIAVGSNISVSIKVTGPKGLVLEKTFAGLSLPAVGKLILPKAVVTANAPVIVAADSVAPSPGQQGEIRSTVTTNAVTLSWTAATDDVARQDELVYGIYRATTDLLNTPASIHSGATLLTTTSAAQATTFTVTTLQPGTKYYFYVIARDIAGNEASYKVHATSTKALLVPVRMMLQLSLAQPGDNSVQTPAFEDVRLIFQECVSCHANGQNSPNLTNFPFVGASGERLSSVMAKISKRINDERKPMPRDGLLPLNERDAIDKWITAGYLAVPTVLATPELALYSVDVSWDSGSGPTASVHISGQSSGQFSQALGTLAVGTDVNVTVKVIGPRRTIVLEKTFSMLTIPESGIFTLPMRASAVDTTPPTPGQQGDLASSDVSTNSATIKWKKATDAVTPQADLMYRVYQSTTSDVRTLISGPTANLTEFAVTASLLPNTNYYFKVSVTDRAGNEAVYRVLTVTTRAADNCLAGGTVNEITAWRDNAATALQTGTESETKIAKRINECFPARVPQCVQRTLDYATRKDLASASNDVSIERSPQKQPPAEILAPNAQGLEYVIPADIEQIAAANDWPTVRYKSRHAGGFDSSTANLLMVYIPGDKANPPVTFDRWINFATPTDTEAFGLTPAPQTPLVTEEDYDADHGFGQNLPRVFTMMSLEHRHGDKPAEVYFQMFDRQTNSSKFKPRSNSDVASACVSCHPNGMRAISPLGLHVRAGEAQLPERDWKAAEKMNDGMIEAAGKKAISWRTGGPGAKSFYNPNGQGPAFGPVVPLNNKGSRTKEFIMGGRLADGSTVSGCYKTRPEISVVDIFNRAPGRRNIYKLSATPSIRWDVISKNMDCSSCHDNVERSSITSKMDFSQVDFKILVDQSMPLGLHLNPLDLHGTDAGHVSTPVVDALTGDERIALANCLVSEFELEENEVLKWLKETSCQE
jgi:mono/diheme cytochrome c family protein